MGLGPPSFLFIDSDLDSVSVHDTVHLAAVQIDIFFSPFFRDEESKTVLMALDPPDDDVLPAWQGVAVFSKPNYLSLPCQFSQGLQGLLIFLARLTNSFLDLFEAEAVLRLG